MPYRIALAGPLPRSLMTTRTGAFAAVSSGDNSNIISARVARETFGVERVVARIYDAKRAAVYERLGIPTVATAPKIAAPSAHPARTSVAQWTRRYTREAPIANASATASRIDDGT